MRYIHVYPRPSAVAKKREIPSVMLNLLSQTIDQRQAALDATHSIPVGDRKSRNSRKLLNIVGNKSCLKRSGCPCNQNIDRADGSTLLLQLSADCGSSKSTIAIERNKVNSAQKLLKLFGTFCRRSRFSNSHLQLKQDSRKCQFLEEIHWQGFGQLVLVL